MRMYLVIDFCGYSYNHRGNHCSVSNSVSISLFEINDGKLLQDESERYILDTEKFRARDVNFYNLVLEYD